MLFDEISVRVSSVSKRYEIYDKPQHRLWQGLLRGRKQFYREFWALKDVSFEVRKGETLGIIGRNGSGKSTLLQIICGTLVPSSGHVEINGRIAALLELGTGFNPEFSGRENVYLNASLLGLAKQEIDERYGEIIEFADIGDFIDQPVKTYSSGMLVRLAFAVAASVDPEVLVVDEAIAVGDIKFQAKCFRRFETLVARGTTILFVTHSTEQIVRHCTRACLLEAGAVLLIGSPRDVSNTYLDLMFGSERQILDMPESQTTGLFDQSTTALQQFTESGENFQQRQGYNKEEYRWGNGKARIVDFYISSGSGPHSCVFRTFDEIRLSMKVVFYESVEKPILGLSLKSPDGVTIFGNNSRDWQPQSAFAPVKAGDIVIASFEFRLYLNSGDYLLSIGVATDVNGEIIPLDRRYDAIHISVSNDRAVFGLVDMNLSFDSFILDPAQDRQYIHSHDQANALH